MDSCSGGGGDDRTSSGGGVCCVWKLIIRALTVAGLVWILLVGSPDGRRATTKTEAAFLAGSTAGKFRGKDRVVAAAAGASEKTVHGPKLDRIAYMSKRRVPNGPDPIHNRRAGKSGKPPGQA